jgi:glycosyltransferase involved in cell wall biosynthesis
MPLPSLRKATHGPSLPRLSRETALISVVMPVYNEEASISEAIERVLAQERVGEVIVVDDCSDDGTREALQALPRHGGLKIFHHGKNLGKGAALRTGFAEATCEIVIVQDADFEYDPSDYGRLVEPMLCNQADVVFGSRFAGGSSHRVLYFWHSLGNKFLTLLSNMATDLNLTDMECGYKAFRREIIRKLRIEENRFGFEPEIVAKVARTGARIFEVGVGYNGRTYAEGKKINWKDGVSAMRCIVKYRVL